MDARLLTVTFDTADAVGLAEWWARALGGEIIAENDGYYVVVALGDGRTGLAFQQVDDPTPGKNRLHLDFGVDDAGPAVAELVAAGATLVAERSMPGFTWTTLADPDGNEFCVAVHG